MKYRRKRQRNKAEIYAYAEEVERAYIERDYRAGTVEYTKTEADVVTFALRGTSKNRNNHNNPGVVSTLKDWSALAWDILHDVRMLPRHNSELGWRPGGFRDAAMAVVEDIVPHLSKAKPIHLTGHSLGAVALLVGEVLVRRGYWVQSVVVFAPPRMGDVPFLKNSPCQISAYKYGRDPVPSLPFWWKRSVECEQIGKKSKAFDALDDHAMSLYTAWFK